MTMLSKSRFLKGRQCLRRLWLDVRQPPEPPIDPDEVWEMREAEGAAVEKLTESLFPGILRVADATDEDDTREQRADIPTLVERTRAALLKRQPIAQAYLQAEGLLSITDILEPRGDDWFLWEVKASNSLKPIHDWDVAFQVEVARRAGLKVVGSGVIRLDGEYVRGAGIDPSRLLVREDRTVAIHSLEVVVQQEIASQLECIAQAAVPAVQPSSHCKSSRDAKKGNRPSTCGHLDDQGYCGSRLPEH